MPEVTGSLKCRTFKLDMVGHVYNPNIHEAEAGGLPLSSDQPGLWNETLTQKRKNEEKEDKNEGVNRG